MEEEHTRTIFCGNLHADVTEALFYELFLQAGPLERVNVPKETRNGKQKRYGFAVFKHSCSVDYAIKLFKDTCLFGLPIRLESKNKKKELTNSSKETEQKQKEERVEVVPEVPVISPHTRIKLGFWPRPVQICESTEIEDIKDQSNQIHRNQNPKDRNSQDPKSLIKDRECRTFSTNSSVKYSRSQEHFKLEKETKPNQNKPHQCNEWYRRKSPKSINLDYERNNVSYALDRICDREVIRDQRWNRRPDHCYRDYFNELHNQTYSRNKFYENQYSSFRLNDDRSRRR